MKPLKINLEEATGLTEITETLESGQQKQLFRNGSARPSNSKIGEYASSRRCTTKPDELFTHIIDEPVKISERSGWQVNSHFCKLDEFAFHI